MNIDTKIRIVELNYTLAKARQAYYVRNEPFLADAEYDRLEQELKHRIADNPEFSDLAPVLTTVGSDLNAESMNPNARVIHEEPFLSIEKQPVEKDVIDWYDTLQKDYPNIAVCLEPKFDGASCELRYRNWKLIQALSRGDGKSGEDITAQIMAVVSIPKTLEPQHLFPPTLNIRGELVMKNSTLARINREAVATGGKVYNSTRNLVSGTMKLKELHLIPDREILMMPWYVRGDDAVLPDSGLARLELLAKAGFLPPLANLVKDWVAVGSMLHQRLRDRETILKQAMSLETDGVVIKVDSHKLRRELGTKRQYTKWQICFKQQAALGITYLREILWQIGRTGKISPVGICDPTVLAGATITNASLCNITYIQNMGLKLGAKVEILRSGDVIPQIKRVLDEGDTEILPPTHCPECDTLLIEADEGGKGIIQHFCTNLACPGIVRGTLEFIGGRDVLEIDGLGPETARKLANGHASDIGELYEFQTACMGSRQDLGEDGFTQRFREWGFDITFLKMLDSLEKAKTASWERWIKALCIPMIGATLGKTVALQCGLQSGDFPNLLDRLRTFTGMKVEGFAGAKMGAILDWVSLPSSHTICRQLFQAGVRPQALEKPQAAAGSPLAGVIFCITGGFDKFGERKQIEVQLATLGAVAKSGVSKKINLLLCGDKPGSKLSAAQKLGISIEGEEWLNKVYSENGLQMFNTAFEVEAV